MQETKVPHKFATGIRSTKNKLRKKQKNVCAQGEKISKLPRMLSLGIPSKCALITTTTPGYIYTVLLCRNCLPSAVSFVETRHPSQSSPNLVTGPDRRAKVTKKKKFQSIYTHKNKMLCKKKKKKYKC
ncbi:unnamed protein product [Ixodes persulcatus]